MRASLGAVGARGNLAPTFALEVAETQAAELLRESYQNKPDYKEDLRVEQVLEQVEQTCDLAQRLQRLGYETPPIPILSRRELAEEIRRKLRGTPEAGIVCRSPGERCRTSWRVTGCSNGGRR